VHDNAADYADPYYHATVQADGSLDFKFSPNIVCTQAQLQFLLINYPVKEWGTYKIGTHIKGADVTGGNVVLNNTWGGPTKPVTIIGATNADGSVTWQYQ